MHSHNWAWKDGFTLLSMTLETSTVGTDSLVSIIIDGYVCLRNNLSIVLLPFYFNCDFFFFLLSENNFSSLKTTMEKNIRINK